MAAMLSDDIFTCIFVNENIWISLQILLKFVHMGPIDIKPPLVQRQTISWTNADPVHRCIYAALGGDELNWINCVHGHIPKTEFWFFLSCNNSAQRFCNIRGCGYVPNHEKVYFQLSKVRIIFSYVIHLGPALLTFALPYLWVHMNLLWLKSSF